MKRTHRRAWAGAQRTERLDLQPGRRANSTARTPGKPHIAQLLSPTLCALPSLGSGLVIREARGGQVGLQRGKCSLRGCSGRANSSGHLPHRPGRLASGDRTATTFSVSPTDAHNHLSHTGGAAHTAAYSRPSPTRACPHRLSPPGLWSLSPLHSRRRVFRPHSLTCPRAPTPLTLRSRTTAPRAPAPRSGAEAT